MTELWKERRAEQKERRRLRVPQRSGEIMALRDLGFIVEEKTPFHLRVNNQIDVWPTHNRWHDLLTSERGGAKNLVDFLKTKLLNQK